LAIKAGETQCCSADRSPAWSSQVLMPIPCSVIYPLI